MVTNYCQWYITSQKSEDLKGSVFPLACLFGWYSQMWQCFFNHSLNQVSSLPSIHFSTFVGDAVQAA